MLTDEQQKVKALLTEAITVLCKNGLKYRDHFTVEGLLGITTDEEEVFLINVNELVGPEQDGEVVEPEPLVHPPPPLPIVKPKPKPINKPMRGGMATNRGGVRQTPVKRKLEQSPIAAQGSNPNTPTMAQSPHSTGSGPHTPSTHDEATPAKRFQPDGDDNSMEETKIKHEPGTEEMSNADWAQFPDDDGGLGDGDNGQNMMNVKTEHHSQQNPTGQGMPKRKKTTNNKTENLPKQFVCCQVCGATFRSNMGLYYHMPHHTGEWKFRCELCEKKYMEASKFKKHMQMHKEQIQRVQKM